MPTAAPRAADQELKRLGIGRKIRLLRESNSVTVDDLARQAGVTPVLLKQIETDVVPPTLGTLLNIAKALGVGMDHFFTDKHPVQKIEHVPAAKRLKVKSSRDDATPRLSYTYESLAWQLVGKHMEPFLIDFNPEIAEQIETASHDGEEFLFVLEGVVLFDGDGRTIELMPGDSLYFYSDLPHRVRAKGPSRARAVAVLLPKAD
ncbi:MAG: XRE family transcriptional regulator [Deltaproteobacteria bacterium]|nr:XRE family transcriptional regulator [Deltaproteobacteria bacterium]